MTTLGCDAGISGIGRYTSTLLNQWLDAGTDLRVYGHDVERSAFVPEDRPVDWCSVSGAWMKPVPSILWHQTRLPTLAKGADVLFLPAGNRRLPVLQTVPAVGTVHDCSSLHVAGKYDRKRDFYIKRVLPKLMQRLTHIITVSESTKADIVDLCGVEPGRVTVIPLAADSDVFRPHDPEFAESHLLQKYGIDSPFLLYIARIEHPGKNHVRLISAFEQLKRQDCIPHKLVFVGPEKERAQEVRRAAAVSPYGEDIHFVGAVPSQDLSVFYSAADAFVFPSLYEGFGLPVLESMASGTRVACSDRSSLPEVGGKPVVLFDPEEPDSIAAAIGQLISESTTERSKRIAEGHHRCAQFSWTRTASETLQLLHSMA